MSLSSTLRRAAAPAALAFMTAFAAANDAHAAGLAPGQCYAKADAEAVLKQEGHVPIIIGERTAVVPATQQNPSGLEKNANVFFLNKQGYGYNIEGDKPLGTPSQTLCVRAAYKNGVLNDPSNPEIPSWGKNIRPNPDGTNDVAYMYTKGMRLVMAAQTYTPQKDGTEKSGKHIAIIMDVGVKDAFGGALSINSAGQASTNFSMDKMGITQKMGEMLAPKTASVQPQPSVAVALK